MTIRNNAYPKGETWNFVADRWAATAPLGIHLNVLSLMQSIGSETVLVLREERQFLDDLRLHGAFTLNLKSGAVRTSAGPVIFMVWWFSPAVNGVPYAAYELLISPLTSPPIAKALEIASHQTHLHLVMLDERHEVFDVVEFENVYNLGNLVQGAQEIGAQLKGYDFERAKQSFFEEYSLDQLMRL